MERKVISRTTIIKEIVEVEKNLYFTSMSYEDTQKIDPLTISLIEDWGIRVSWGWKYHYIILASFNRNRIMYLVKKYNLPEMSVTKIKTEEVNYIEK